LIKDPTHQGACQLHYHDIGDYLDRKQKLATIKAFGHYQALPWDTLTPNAQHDWINTRDPLFESYLPLGDKSDPTTPTVFETYSGGLKTNRDTWAYNFSKLALSTTMGRMIVFYNQQVEAYKAYQAQGGKQTAEQFIDLDPTKISWSRGLKNDLGRHINREFKPDALTKSMYRPYCKQWAYFDKHFNDMIYQMPKIFPYQGAENRVICVSGVGASKEFSALMVDALPNLHFHDTGQCFPRYTYVPAQQGAMGLPTTHGQPAQNGFVQVDNISDATVARFTTHYNDPTITADAIFNYVYGLLHSPHYKQRFANNLKKMLPRLPFAPNFWAFSNAGQQLATLHLNYETVDPYPLVEHCTQLALEPAKLFRVEQMRFPRGQKIGDRPESIQYNNWVTLSGIPPQAYDYVVNGKPALAWVMERYAITKDKASGLENNANQWSDDPRYIVELVKRIVRVSVDTVAIVATLPHPLPADEPSLASV
jgi:predicted helicase